MKIYEGINRNASGVKKNEDNPRPSKPAFRGEATGGLTEGQRDAVAGRLGIY